MKTIKEAQAMDAWKEALKYTLNNGKDFDDENKRVCREVMHLTAAITAPAEQTIAKPIERLHAFPHWKYPSLEEIKRAMLSNTLAPDYAYGYGQRIFNFQNAVNQVNDYVVPLLKDTKETRRAMVSIFDPINDAKLISTDTPGLIAFDFKLREEKLHITAIIRSNDIFFGWPANVYQAFVIQEYVRHQLGVDIGTLTTFSVSSHVFHDQMEFIKEVLKED